MQLSARHEPRRPHLRLSATCSASESRPGTSTNLHVLPEGCPEIERMLVFRDRLRSNQAERELYEGKKRELARRQWKYVQNYADSKGG